MIKNNKIIKSGVLLFSLLSLCSCNNSNAISSRYFDVTFTPSSISTNTWTWEEGNESSSTSSEDITTSVSPKKSTTVNIKNSSESFIATTTITSEYKYEYVSITKKMYDEDIDNYFTEFYVEVNYKETNVNELIYPSEKMAVKYTKESISTNYIETTTEEITYKKEVEANIYKNVVSEKPSTVSSYNVSYYCSLDEYKSYLKDNTYQIKFNPKYEFVYFKTGYNILSKPKTIYTAKSKSYTLHNISVSAL